MRRGKGPGDQEDPGTRGPGDQENQRTRGPGDQRIRGTWNCFSGKFIFFFQGLSFFSRKLRFVFQYPLRMTSLNFWKLCSNIWAPSLSLSLIRVHSTLTKLRLARTIVAQEAKHLQQWYPVPKVHTVHITGPCHHLMWCHLLSLLRSVRLQLKSVEPKKTRKAHRGTSWHIVAHRGTSPEWIAKETPGMAGLWAAVSFGDKPTNLPCFDDRSDIRIDMPWTEKNCRPSERWRTGLKNPPFRLSHGDPFFPTEPRSGALADARQFPTSQARHWKKKQAWSQDSWILSLMEVKTFDFNHVHNVCSRSCHTISYYIT